MDKLTLSFWLNDKYLDSKNVNLLNKGKWSPAVKFRDRDNFVILNGFTTHPDS